MSRKAKFWITLVLGLIYTLFGWMMTHHLLAVILTYGAQSVIAAIIAASCNERNQRIGGWWTFAQGMAFCVVGGFITGLLYVWIACGLAAVVYGAGIGGIKLEEEFQENPSIPKAQLGICSVWC